MEDRLKDDVVLPLANRNTWRTGVAVVCVPNSDRRMLPDADLRSTHCLRAFLDSGRRMGLDMEPQTQRVIRDLPR